MERPLKSCLWCDELNYQPLSAGRGQRCDNPHLSLSKTHPHCLGAKCSFEEWFASCAPLSLSAPFCHVSKLFFSQMFLSVEALHPAVFMSPVRSVFKPFILEGFFAIPDSECVSEIVQGFSYPWTSLVRYHLALSLSIELPAKCFVLIFPFFQFLDKFLVTVLCVR